MRRRRVLALTGSALAVSGACAVLFRRVGFGWTANTPLAEPGGTPRLIVLDAVNTLALLGVLIGAVLVGAAAGSAAARRQAR